MVATKKKPVVSDPGYIRERLALATCSLLCHSAGAQSFDNDWVLDLSFMSYQEFDDRISVNKLIGNVNGSLSDTDRIKLNLILDSMTGATPTGGLAAGTGLVSVTGTSGGGFSASGEPLALATFDDTRLAVDFEWSHDYTRSFRLNYGASVSVENDYNSFGGSITLEMDSEQKLTTYTTGIAFTSDRIGQLNGETPAPLTEVRDAQFFDEGERTTLDFIIGFSRVLTPRTIMQLNVSFNESNGYHSDPYKVVSIANSQDVELTRIYESRPGARKRNTLYSKVVHQFDNGDNLHLSYRYYTDDWDVDSHTIDSHYRFNFQNRHYLQPHLRLYTQAAANFYTRTLLIGEALPEFVSADNRLGKMQAYTAGIKYGLPLSDNGELRLRLDYVNQSIDNAIVDTNEAVVFQMSFKKEFE